MDKKFEKDWIWWKHGVVYHIYPLSFYDSNNDGYGDIRGIIHKLDYLSDMGIDAIWLSPIFKSPMADHGYDVSDYRAIDPVFGTMDDFRCLLKEAHKRNIRVIIDMIMNHTSDQHRWFLESKSSRLNPKRDWYIWKDPRNGKSPNRWKSAFGGSAWQLDKRTGQYYLHTFFKEQPDLNWRSKALKEAFMEEFEFWLDFGVDGFRLDVVNMIVKDKKFRENPGLLMGLFGRKQWFSRNHPKSYKIIRQLRKLLDSYDDRMCVGEVYTLPPGDPELVGSYLDEGKNGLNLAFDFSLMFRPWNARKYYQAIEKWYNSIPPDGWPCNVFSNHDLRRNITSKWFSNNDKEKARVSAMLLLTMKGTPFIYYGEEIGMQNASIKKEAIKDRLGKKYWPFYKGRDKTRTPMQWSAEKHAGFSRINPWLPANPDYFEVNVENQQNDDHSLYNFYKSLIRLRKSYPALEAGKWIPMVKGEKGIIIYYRIYKSQKLVVVLNFTSRTVWYPLDEKTHWKILLSTHKFKNESLVTSDLRIHPFEATLFEDQ